MSETFIAVIDNEPMANILSDELNRRAGYCGDPHLSPPWRVNSEAELCALKSGHPLLPPRNAAASAFIRKLAKESITDVDLAERYEQISDEMDKDEFAEIRGRLLGDLGFRWFPESADEVLKELLLVLIDPERLVDRAA
ncbi:hypothetical protein ACK6D9_11700 [Hoeflea sp. Naph1]|uniref:hypothetical protein n=1 Tax=Hoeflea sp. Naph1 TaxID=3388653 RepID=UPI00398FB408